MTSELITSGKLTTITNVGGRTVVYNSDFGALTVPTLPEAIGILGAAVSLVVADAAITTFENTTDMVSQLTKKISHEDKKN